VKSPAPAPQRPTATNVWTTCAHYTWMTGLRNKKMSRCRKVGFRRLRKNSPACPELVEGFHVGARPKGEKSPRNSQFPGGRQRQPVDFACKTEAAYPLQRPAVNHRAIFTKPFGLAACGGFGDFNRPVCLWNGNDNFRKIMLHSKSRKSESEGLA
jgi:hypothetical protein